LNLQLAGGILMASYHFRVKTDTKPDGKRISASVHVDYISRQGKYKNEGEVKNLETNFIEFADKKILGEETIPMYVTENFGKILYTERLASEWEIYANNFVYCFNIGKRYIRQSAFNFKRQSKI